MGADIVPLTKLQVPHGVHTSYSGTSDIVVPQEL